VLRWLYIATNKYISTFEIGFMGMDLSVLKSVVRHSIEVVMAITRECNECHEGMMEKPFPLHSYDFDSDGKPIFSCNECGYGYPDYTPIQ